MGAHVVLFKRDLRVRDHGALARACDAALRSGDAVVCVYVVEPTLIGSAEWDARHSAFIGDCLEDLDRSLRALGSGLTILRGELPAALDDLALRLSGVGGIAGLWSHQETGGELTFERDKRVARWAKARGVIWVQTPQNGVVRGLRDRDGWARRWDERMAESPWPVPARVPCVSGRVAGWDFGPRVWLHGWGAGERSTAEASEWSRAWQRGGESRAEETLGSFLHQRGENYRREMSTPVAGFDACSRLSAHLAWGSISIRSVVRAVEHRREELLRGPRGGATGRWLESLASFQSRLRWHCHFMQKLESEPEIERRNMHRGYDGLRCEDREQWTPRERLRFEAWCAGRTGYPFIDACMRCLNATGWMNFRMRSMLVSFASMHLWLHWRFTGEHLARMFTDFEPGIHWSQMQMQSGTTGINTVRIYNPVKQGRDQDPTGAFIRRWVPELADVPGDAVHEPWTLTGSGRGGSGGRGGRGGSAGSGDAGDAGLFAALAEREAGPPRAALMVDAGAYPSPIVDHVAAYRDAKARIFEVRGRWESKAEAHRVYLKHGSRRSPGTRGGRETEDRGTG